MHNLYEILSALDASNIHYHIGRYRDDYVTIHATIAGKRLEIDVSSNGLVETAIFAGNEDLTIGKAFVLNLISEEAA